MDAWQWLDQASDEQASAWLLTCCGSTYWVTRMLAHRPFGNQEALHAIARDEWFGLFPQDWKDAFSQHPRLGDREALRARFPETGALSEREQAGVAAATDEELNALAEGNRQYEAKFGYIFIACASGQSASSLLAMLRARLEHDPAHELMVAAGEQAKITALRLDRLPSASVSAASARGTAPA